MPHPEDSMPSACRAGFACLLPLLAAACATTPASLSSQPSAGSFTLFGDDSAEAPDWDQRLIDPVTAPYLFESPVIDSQVRPILIRHWFPKDGIFGGGRVDIAAVQLRLALTERLAFIAVKDGRAEFEPHAGPDQSGTIDVAGGLKYALLVDPEAGTLVTAGLTYETDAGDADILQGGSHGVWRPFLSGAADGEDYDILWNVGYEHGVSDHETADFIDWHLHCSWETDTPWRPLVEVNGIHYIADGDGLPLDVDGLDYTNIGSQDLDNADWITGALGVRYRLTESVDLGLAWERPLTQRDDIFEDRVTADAVIRF
jgi:hypothetical protein